MQNPFAGPKPIARNEPIFGRDREITELRHLLISERLVLLHAPSGAGKTSLINAGIIPECAGFFHVCPPTRVSFEMPGTYGYPVVCSAQVGGSPSSEDVLQDLPLQDFIAALPANKNKLLILDHFESTVRAALANPGWHTGFFRQLGQLLNDPSIWALISLREDFVAPILPLLEYIPTRLRARYRLGFLSRAQAELAMIRTAASSHSRFFADGAAARLAETLSCVNVQNPDGSFTLTPGDAVEPLQLQVVCRRLWDAMPDDDLSIDPVDIEQFGDVNTALGAYYSQAVEALSLGDPLRQRAIRDWFQLHLISPGGLRGQVRRGLDHSEGLENQIIEQLLETHLVRAELRGSVTWYELAHDALVAPVLASNKLWFESNLSLFQRRAALWAANDNADTFLLTGQALLDAECWRKANFFLVTPEENDFFEKSQQKQAVMDREADLRRRLVHTTVNAELERALVAPSPSSALAHLAYALRVNPDSLVVRARIFDLLQHAPSWLPLPPLDAPEQVHVSIINPAGTLAVVGKDASADAAFVSLWNTRAAQPGPNQPPFANRPLDGAFSADGRYLLTFAFTAEVELFNLTQSPPTVTELPITGTPSRAIFSANGARLLILTTGDGAPATLWDPASAQPIGDPIPGVHRALFSPDSTRFLTRSAGNTAQVWDAATGEPVGEPITHSGPILHGIFTPDSAGVFTSSQQTMIQRWPGSESVPHNTPATVARFSDDCTLLATVHNNAIHIRQVKTGKPIGAPCTLPAPPLGLYFTPDNRALVVVTEGNSMYVCDPASGRVRGNAFSGLSCLGTAVGRDKPHLLPAARRTNHGVQIGYLATGLEFAPSLQNATPGQLAAWSPDGASIAIADGGSARRWNCHTGAPENEPIVHVLPITVLAFSPDGARLLTVSRDDVLRITPGPVIKSPLLMNAQWSPDGAQIRTTHWNGSTRYWDAATGAEVAAPAAAPPIPEQPRNESAYLTAISPDGSHACTVSSSQDRHVLTLFSPDGTIEIPQSAAVSIVEFSPDSLSLLTLNEKNEVQVWCPQTGARIGAVIAPAARLFSARFNPDGSFLVTVPLDGPVQLWDALTGLPAAQPFYDPGHVRTAVFNPDSTLLLTVGPDSPAQLRAIYSHEDGELLAQIAEAVGGETLNLHDAVIPLPAQQAALNNLPREAAWLRKFLPD